MIADTSGDWSADFGGSFDIVFDTIAEASVHDADQMRPASGARLLVR